jgi:hypothetical protein
MGLLLPEFLFAKLSSLLLCLQRLMESVRAGLAFSEKPIHLGARYLFRCFQPTQEASNQLSQPELLKIRPDLGVFLIADSVHLL